MLDAIKSMTAGKNKAAQKQTDELEQLIATAREERGAISAMLTALTARSAKLAPLGKTLEQVSERTAGVTQRLDEIAKRLSSLDDRTKELAELEHRIESLKDAARQAEQATQKALGSDGELQKHREAVQHLSSQALGTQAALETLKNERVTLDELRRHLQQSDAEVQDSLGQAGTLKAELDHVRTIATGLAQDYAKIREASREAREDTAAALTTVKEVENKLGPLTQLHELSQSTEERLNSLNGLAEHVSHKVKALETQQQAVEHAVVQANRVSEMVWAMDVQIGKLNDGLKEVARVDDTLTRTEKLTAEAGAQLQTADRLRLDAENETAKLKREAAALLDAVRGQVDALSLKKNEFDAFDLRLHTLHSSVGDAEVRMQVLAAGDQNLVELRQNIDSMSTRFEALSASADDLTEKQHALESLKQRLDQVDELARQTSWQFDSLRASRQDLDALREEIQEFYKSHGEASKLADKLGADRGALESVAERLAGFSVSAPELEARMNVILGKLALVEDGTVKASRLQESVAELDAQVSRVTARVPFVEKFEVRLDGLNVLSADVDRKLADQLARRTELETLKVHCDGLVAQIADAQHKLDAVRALQTSLVPLVADVDALKVGVDAAAQRLDNTQFTELAVIEREKRCLELAAASAIAATEVAERTRQMQALGEELARAAKIKDDMLVELGVVQARQRDATAQTQAAEDHLKRAEEMFRQLESRRSQLAFSEKKLEGVEARLADIKHITRGLEESITAIASREQLVMTVKAAVESVHTISARSKADLDHVADHRGEVTMLRGQVDQLLSRIGETDERIAAIDATRTMVDEVQTKADAIVHVLDDVRINLETLGEQKAVVDHVAQKVAQLEFTLQEARNTLRTLQHERELAERIEQGIKQLRTRTTKSESGKKKSA